MTTHTNPNLSVRGHMPLHPFGFDANRHKLATIIRWWRWWWWWYVFCFFVHSFMLECSCICWCPRPSFIFASISRVGRILPPFTVVDQSCDCYLFTSQGLPHYYPQPRTTSSHVVRAYRRCSMFICAPSFVTLTQSLAGRTNVHCCVVLLSLFSFSI
jgi:hypothetical protein